MSAAPETVDAPTWSTERMRDVVWKRFGKRACWYQLEVAKAVYAGKDVLGCAPTGAGKTLSFWIPLIMAQEDKLDRVMFVVSPLNVLAKQNVDVLMQANISALALTAKNADVETFKVSLKSLYLIDVLTRGKNIQQGKYQVVVTNPEILMANDKMGELWKIPKFTRRILAFIFDEGHCIYQWGIFRKNYMMVGMLRHLISVDVPFYVASATLPPPVITETSRLLRLRKNETVKVLCSNDRPEIRLMVCPLVYLAGSYKDLEFLIPFNWNEGMDEPEKFLVFFDNTKEAERATKHMRSRLRREFHSRIEWFHSTMSQEFREQTAGKLRRGELWGLFCTDAFGMVRSDPRHFYNNNKAHLLLEGNGHWQRPYRCSI
jgi:superfamily II DNA helicase RecQ